MARAFLLLKALEAEERRKEVLERCRFRQHLRDSANPLALPDAEFKALYRLTKPLFHKLCSELRPHMVLKQRQTKVSLECRILTALSFYATGSYQKPVGMNFLHQLSQPSVSNAIKEVTCALNNIRILKKYIRFPQTQEERQEIINGFHSKFGFPGVLGCIDGTHVALMRPNDDEKRFLNRKNYYSRNIQIICDSDLNILNVDATFGGASHDAYIWCQSEGNRHLQQLYHDGETVWFLGDSGYPLRPWLLTPILNADRESPEEHYTNVHSRTRNTVERCIGELKARWRCLLAHKVLHYDHHTVAKIVKACCVLHNMANGEGLPVPKLTPAETEAERIRQEPHGDPVEDQTESQLLQNGHRQLSILVQTLWKNRI